MSRVMNVYNKLLWLAAMLSILILAYVIIQYRQRSVTVKAIKGWQEQYCTEEVYTNWIDESCRGIIR